MKIKSLNHFTTYLWTNPKILEIIISYSAFSNKRPQTGLRAHKQLFFSNIPVKPTQTDRNKKNNCQNL